VSWSVSRIGKSKVISEKIDNDIRSFKCAEPEESIKNTIGSAIRIASDSYPVDMLIRVIANGSQSVISTNPIVAVNQLIVSVEPFFRDPKVTYVIEDA
jgi:hypothetical protein